VIAALDSAGRTGEYDLGHGFRTSIDAAPVRLTGSVGARNYLEIF
jgi:hypothetical protein